MKLSTFRLTPLFVAATILSAALPVRAQFAGAGGVVGPAALSGAAFGYGVGAGAGLGWGTQWMQNPYEGYLNGAANLTMANAQYQQTIEQAKLTRQDVKRSSIDTRRKLLEEQQYEQSIQPDPEQIRQKQMMKSLNRARNNPPPTEIWAGTALNDLLRAVQSAGQRAASGPDIPLAPDVLRHVNMTTGTTYGGIGLLRGDGALSWPNVLQQPAFDDQRKTLDQVLPEAVKQARSGPVPYATTSKIDRAVKDLQNAVDAAVADLTPSEFTESARYVRELKDSVKVLKQNDVAKYFRTEWTPQGSTVADLVQQMTREGLKFAPAVSGDETYYTSLYRALADYDSGMAQLTASAPRK